MNRKWYWAPIFSTAFAHACLGPVAVGSVTEELDTINDVGVRSNQTYCTTNDFGLPLHVGIQSASGPTYRSVVAFECSEDLRVAIEADKFISATLKLYKLNSPGTSMRVGLLPASAATFDETEADWYWIDGECNVCWAAPNTCNGFGPGIGDCAFENVSGMPGSGTSGYVEIDVTDQILCGWDTDAINDGYPFGFVLFQRIPSNGTSVRFCSTDDETCLPATWPVLILEYDDSFPFWVKPQFWPTALQAESECPSE